MDYLLGLVEKEALKKLRSWFENYWMEMVRSLQIRQGFLYSGYLVVKWSIKLNI